MATNIKSRSADYSQWYVDVIKAAELADYSPVKGCMVIRPTGYAIWEAIQRELDRRFRETGHVNAYFPLLIPQSFLTREAEHIEGFAMECAVVTHTRLEKGPEGLRPGGPLEEPLIIRPTSETIIGHMYAQWIHSYRDLPLLINQWCNVMRWEMRTRLFLRTSEFLWQEGHTAHETKEEAEAETLRMLDVYAEFAENVLALPVMKGRKTKAETFPGADATYCIEALMQDGKALQAGTSHNLGQNFARAFDIKFLGRDQKEHHAWTSSWGVSTRLIGATIMAHSDDEGLILPPNVAPHVAVVVPVFRDEVERQKVRAFINRILSLLVGETEVDAAGRRTARGEIETYFFDRVTHQAILVDWRPSRPGDKHYHWEQRGIPFRIEVGPRDVDAGTVILKKRFDRSKESVKLDEVSSEWLRVKLRGVQRAMLDKAIAFVTTNTRRADTIDELKGILSTHGGFVRSWFTPDEATEVRIKEECKATVRCIPFDQPGGTGKDIVTGESASTEVLFAQAY